MKGENLKKFNQKQNEVASKFKPLGLESEQSHSPKVPEPSRQSDEEAESQDTADTQKDQTDEKHSSTNKSGIAAAGFKTFIKKSISIKINSAAGDTNENSITAETRLLKENKHISKKRSHQNFLDIKKGREF